MRIDDEREIRPLVFPPPRRSLVARFAVAVCLFGYIMMLYGSANVVTSDRTGGAWGEAMAVYLWRLFAGGFYGMNLIILLTLLWLLWKRELADWFVLAMSGSFALIGMGFLIS